MGHCKDATYSSGCKLQIIINCISFGQLKEGNFIEPYFTFNDNCTNRKESALIKSTMFSESLQKLAGLMYTIKC